MLIHCVKLNREAEAMLSPPFPGPLGEKVFKQVSQEAWGMWLNHQTMIINEYRLSLIDPKAREFLLSELQKYFFGTGSDTPSGYVPNQ